MMLKRAVRKTIRMARAWLPESPSPHDFSNDYDAYPWLNTQHREISAEIGNLRPQYLWCVIDAAYMAKALGLPAVSVLERGVAWQFIRSRLWQ